MLSQRCWMHGMRLSRAARRSEAHACACERERRQAPRWLREMERVQRDAGDDGRRRGCRRQQRSRERRWVDAASESEAGARLEARARRGESEAGRTTRGESEVDAGAAGSDETRRGVCAGV
jgi:hypothetical protein